MCLLIAYKEFNVSERSREACLQLTMSFLRYLNPSGLRTIPPTGPSPVDNEDSDVHKTGNASPIDEKDREKVEVESVLEVTTAMDPDLNPGELTFEEGMHLSLRD